jgi:uncharacterized protein (TIGR02145 family)
VKIGNQEWMTENLRVTKYNDGSPISLDTSDETWVTIQTAKYCFYKNSTNADSIKKYGALYNWYVVAPANGKRIAPAGWHVPTDAEWTELEEHLTANGYNWDGTTTGNKIAKSVATKTDWLPSMSSGAIGNVVTKNNSSGFSALPGGYRDYHSAEFSALSDFGNWWSATESDVLNAYGRDLYYDNDNLESRNCGKSYGFSVRLLRD